MNLDLGSDGRPLYYDRQGNPLSLLEWAKIVEAQDMAYKIVKRSGTDDVWVSTVWLGIDHSFGEEVPLIFETMIFGLPPEVDEYCERYPTEAAALAGHDRAVAWLRDHLSGAHP